MSMNTTLGPLYWPIVLLVAIVLIIIGLLIRHIYRNRQVEHASQSNHQSNHRSVHRSNRKHEQNDCYFCAVVKHADSEHSFTSFDRSIEQSTDSECSSPSSNSRSSSGSDYESMINSNQQTLLNRTFSPFSMTFSQTQSMPQIEYQTPFVVVFAPRSAEAWRHLLVVPRTHLPPVKQLIKQSIDQSADSLDEMDDFDDFDDYDSDDGWSDAPNPRLISRLLDPPEEKELSPSQLINHMHDVGKLLLDRPELLRNRDAGIRKRRSACDKLSFSRQRKRSHRYQSDSDSENESDQSTDSSGYISNHAEEKSIVIDAADRCQITQRKRTQPSNPTPILSFQSSNNQPINQTSSCDDLHEHLLGDSDIPHHQESVDSDQSSQQRDQRLCFRVPARCNNGHLVMHALELPVTSWKARAKFRTGTPWCWSVNEALQRCDDE